MRFLLVTWRDLWRNRRRTLLTGMVMAFSVVVMVFFIAFGDGAHTKMIRSMTDSFLGHAQIQAAGYLEDPDLEKRLEPGQVAGIMDALPGTPGVTGFAPRVLTGGLISKKVPDPEDPEDLEAYKAMTSEGALVVGVTPKLERTVTTVVDSVVPDDPAARCLRGCRAALAEIYAVNEPRCQDACKDAAAGFEGERCARSAAEICAGSCDPGDDLCAEEDCTARYADYCEPARFLGDEDPLPDNLHRGEAVLGAALGKVLGVGVGDRVALTTGAAEGRSYGALFKVVGLVKTGSVEINRTFAITHYDKLGAGLGIPGAATSFVLAVDDLDDADALAAGVQERLSDVDGVVALSWRQLSPEMDIFVKLDQGSLLVMLALFVMIVGVILANVVTMSVMERTREYGVRMALGESPARITAGLLGEILLLSLLASAVGATIGGALNLYYATAGLDFGMGEMETTGVIIDSIYNTESSVYGFVFAIGTVVGFSILGALIPAWRIRRLRPVDALRFV
jgi:ABC-type lipoprotein release transport system permease subunit